MESFMPATSWQTSASAKYYNCVSPISPGSSVASPSSPTLYQGITQQDDGLFPQIGNGSSLGTGLNKDLVSSRSQLATELLKTLEDFQDLETFQVPNEFGNDWTEENANLELFNELSVLEFTPPAVAPLQDFGQQNNSSVTTEGDNEVTLPKDSEALDELSAEFMDIINSLPKTTTANWEEELIDISDLIYNSPAETQVYHPTEVVQPSSGEAVQEAVVTMSDSSTDESENEEDLFMETDVNNAASELGATSTCVYLPTAEETSLSLISYSSLSEDEDHGLLTDEKMLDALLVGNLSEAITLLPNVTTIPVQPVVSCVVPAVPAEPKPTKAQRKPTNQRRSKKAKTPKIEKIIKKKEQNKSAALRYRMKKKMEVELTLEREGELQSEHNDLVKQKEELAKEIQMVKQLLRAVFNNRKSKMQTVKKY